MFVDWTGRMLAGYKDNGANIRVIVLIGKGSGGVAEMAERMDSNQVCCHVILPVL